MQLKDNPYITTSFSELSKYWNLDSFKKNITSKESLEAFINAYMYKLTLKLGLKYSPIRFDKLNDKDFGFYDVFEQSILLNDNFPDLLLNEKIENNNCFLKNAIMHYSPANDNEFKQYCLYQLLDISIHESVHANIDISIQKKNKNSIFKTFEDLNVLSERNHLSAKANKDKLKSLDQAIKATIDDNERKELFNDIIWNEILISANQQEYNSSYTTNYEEILASSLFPKLANQLVENTDCLDKFVKAQNLSNAYRFEYDKKPIEEDLYNISSIINKSHNNPQTVKSKKNLTKVLKKIHGKKVKYFNLPDIAPIISAPKLSIKTVNIPKHTTQEFKKKTEIYEMYSKEHPNQIYSSFLLEPIALKERNPENSEHKQRYFNARKILKEAYNNLEEEKRATLSPEVFKELNKVIGNRVKDIKDYDEIRELGINEILYGLNEAFSKYINMEKQKNIQHEYRFVATHIDDITTKFSKKLPIKGIKKEQEMET